MANELRDTVALVTGASSGIGEATAHALARLGAKVAIAARRRDRLESLAASIRAHGGTAHVVEANIAVPAQAASAVERTVDAFGGLDVLINNAGVMFLGPMVGAPLEEWQRMIDLNVTALVRCTHAALPYLLDAAENGTRRVADVINISSVAGRIASNGAGVYNATKFAVGAFSESLRQEVGSRHVRVGLVEPGRVTTELASHNRPEILENIRSRFSPITEPLQSADIADAVAYMVTRPRHIAINELLIRPTEQES